MTTVSHKMISQQLFPDSRKVATVEKKTQTLICPVDQLGEKYCPKAVQMIKKVNDSGEEQERYYQSAVDESNQCKTVWYLYQPETYQKVSDFGEQSLKMSWKVYLMKVKVTKIVRKIHKSVAPRRQRLHGKYFGQAKLTDNKSCTIISKEDTRILPPNYEEEELKKKSLRRLEKESSPEKEKKTAYVPKFKRRGEFSQPESMDGEDRGRDTNELRRSKNAYQPPSRQRRMEARNRDDGMSHDTIRVNNLAPDMTEDDLANLFQTVGQLQRNGVKIIRSYKNNDAQYAFIRYRNPESLDQAIAKFHQRPVPHFSVIIHVERAKQKRRRD